MQLAATHWLPKIKKYDMPRTLTFHELYTSLTRGEKTGAALFLVIIEAMIITWTIISVNQHISNDTVTTSRIAIWTLAQFYTPVFATMMALGARINYTVCSNGHIAKRSHYSRNCNQCGVSLIRKHPLLP
jgi:hypothetical protein